MGLTHFVVVLLLAVWLYSAGVDAKASDNEVLVEDPYGVMGLDKSATARDIKRAYRKLSLKYHPDKSSDPNAAEKFAEISAAYEIIGDPDKRTVFDDFGNQKYHSHWQYQQAQAQGKNVGNGDFYKGSDLVKNFEPSDVDKMFTDSKLPWMVEFYAPWCVHCQEMMGEYKKAAILLEDQVRFGAVNCERHQNLCHEASLRSYPTLRYFTKHQFEYEPVIGIEHTADAIFSWVEEAKNSQLINLDADSFREQVTNGPKTDLWIVDYSAGAWCGPCTNAKPALRSISSKLRGLVKVGIVECDQHRPFCMGEAAVGYYPFFKLYAGSPQQKAAGAGTELKLEMRAMPADNLMTLITEVVLAMARTQDRKPTSIFDEEVDLDELMGASEEEDDELDRIVDEAAEADAAAKDDEGFSEWS